MKCKYCGSEMRKDDRDFNSKGNYDDYWDCDNCKASCNEIVRYGKTQKIDWLQQESERE